jgi:hypothetical protein
MPTSIDYTKLITDSLSVFKKNAKSAYKNAKPYAEHEFRQLAEDAVFLAQLRADGEIDDDELKHRLEMQKLAAANVLLAVESIGLVAAQNTINGVMTLISKAIETAIGVALPI